MERLRCKIRAASKSAVLRLVPNGQHKNRKASQTRHQGSEPLPHLQDDVIYEIAQHLDTGHIYKLLFLKKSIYEIIQPVLWSDIDTQTNVDPERQINELVKVLKVKPEKALLIKRWVIGMDVILVTNDSKLPAAMARVIVELAKEKYLTNLKKFWWFWEKGPPEELWTSLQTSCPLLKDIGVRRGPDDLIIDPKSSLLKFRDLVGFHLTTHGVHRFLYSNQIQAIGASPIPLGLYDMLVKHSPRLQELTFDGSCPQQSLWDVWPILRATWPELRSLSLGMIKDPKRRSPSAQEASVMIEFMQRHQQLRELRFLGAAHWASNEGYKISSHKSLNSFWGKYAQLKGAEHLPSLRSVNLTDLFLDSANYLGILRCFKDITALGLIVDMQHRLAKDVCWRIFEACPMLVRLDLRFRQGLSNYTEIAETSRKAIHLRHLALAGQSNLMGNATVTSQFSRGVAIIQRNPRLDSFALYFGEQFTLAGVSGATSDRYTYGEFIVLRDVPGGKPRGLLVKEVRKGIGGNFAYRYVREITKDLQAPANLVHPALFGYGEPSQWWAQ